MSVGVRGRFSVAGDAVLWKTFPFREAAEQLHYKYTKDMQPSGRVVFGISLILCLTRVGVSMHMANVELRSFILQLSSTFRTMLTKKKT